MTRTVRVTRFLPADPGVVYRAWTDARVMSQWISGHAHVELDPRPGGRILVDMRDAEDSHLHEGSFSELRPHEHLAFTWQSEATGDTRTLVSVTLEGVDDGTRLELVQEGLEDDAMAEDHRLGWTEMLEVLEDYLRIL